MCLLSCCGELQYPQRPRFGVRVHSLESVTVCVRECFYDIFFTHVISFSCVLTTPQFDQLSFFASDQNEAITDAFVQLGPNLNGLSFLCFSLVTAFPLSLSWLLSLFLPLS